MNIHTNIYCIYCIYMLLIKDHSELYITIVYNQDINKSYSTIQTNSRRLILFIRL